MDARGRARRTVPRAVGVAALVLMVPTTGACDGEAPSSGSDQARAVVTAAPPPSSEPVRRRRGAASLGRSPAPAGPRGGVCGRAPTVRSRGTPTASRGRPAPGWGSACRPASGGTTWRPTGSAPTAAAPGGGSGRPRRLRGERQHAPVLRPASTRTVVAPWHESVAVDTTGFEPGAYLFKLVTGSGWQAAVPYVVTSTSVEGRVVVVAPVATWQAYNAWGGYSLYAGPSGDRRAWRVSFDRPYLGGGHGRARVRPRPRRDRRRADRGAARLPHRPRPAPGPPRARRRRGLRERRARRVLDARDASHGGAGPRPRHGPRVPRGQHDVLADPSRAVPARGRTASWWGTAATPERTPSPIPRG